MKTKIVLFTALAGLCYIVGSSNASGPAAGSGGNCTGVNASATSCGGGGCHGGNSGTTTATITVDSAGGTHVTQYIPGMTYTVTVAGTNSVALPKFGFQFASVKGTSPAQTQAGTFTGLPAGVAQHTLSAINYVEHNAGALSGVTSGVYSKSFQWVAPAAGSGSVKMYLTINAVNGNGSAEAADVSSNINKTLTEGHPTAISNITTDFTISAFPNPAINTLNVALSNATGGIYTILAYDLNGNCVASSSVTVSGSATSAAINTSGWATGLYNIVIAKDGNSKVIPVVKQ